MPAAIRLFNAACYYGASLGPQAYAPALYNYAISVGQLGDFEEAEKCFKKTLALDEKGEGKDGVHASMRWFELARLYQAWDKNLASIEAYEKAC